MIDSLLKLARPEILNLTPYSSARRESSAQGIYLNANENPYAKEDALNRYPQPQPDALKTLLANLYQIDPAQILMTRGADEGIDLLIRAFCSAGKDAIMVCPPTYDMYALSARIQHAQVLTVPLIAESFALDIEAILRNWQDNCKLIFLCSPNNPTGNTFAREDVLHLCKKLSDKALVVVDEAYIEFSKNPSIKHDLNQCDNLVVLRTLSKAYGMAGARCGAVLAHQQIIQLLEKIISPYPLASPVILAVLRELNAQNLENVRNQVATIQAERDKLIYFLQSQSFVEKVWPSEANFILIKVKDAASLIEHCGLHHIIIRDRSRMLGLSDCVRISIGIPEENAQLMAIMENYTA